MQFRKLFRKHPPVQQQHRIAAAAPSPLLTLPVPPCASALSQSKQHDVAAWGKACDNAHAQLEHQLNRITNLELLLKYGSNAWRAQAQLDEALLKQMEGTLQGLRK